MLESALEKKLREGIDRLGGLCYKFVSPGNDGVPDRIVVMPGGRIYFVELKTRQGRVNTLQRLQHARLCSCGADVRILKGRAEMLKFLEELTPFEI